MIIERRGFPSCCCEGVGVGEVYSRRRRVTAGARIQRPGEILVCREQLRKLVVKRLWIRPTQLRYAVNLVFPEYDRSILILLHVVRPVLSQNLIVDAEDLFQLP